MAKYLKFATTAPAAVQEFAKQLGSNIRLARKRRSLTLRDLASRAGIAYDTARAVETGNVQTGLGAYLALIWALGLESHIAGLLRPELDLDGARLELTRTRIRVRHRKDDASDEF